MCGLVGWLGGGAVAQQGEQGLRRMADRIAERGPDGAGYWVDAARQVGLGHRRLAVVDLSPAGHQPMHGAAGRFVLAFNGEIYNHLALRAELAASAAGAPAWRGHSDTETLLAGFEVWGIEATLERCIGMFAFAAWDCERAQLTLGRDRLGEKPLYYGWQGEGEQPVLLFGSDLKALRAHPAFAAAVDRDALRLLMRLGYVPAPHSIYEGIAKLAPGCLVTLSLQQREAAPRPYWSGLAAARDGVATPFAGSDSEAVDTLERLLTDAVGQQMVADVPLGAFLSGGIDSSTVVALMQAQSARPVKTFSIGFREQSHDEAEHARSVARHLGTEHTELYVSADEALDAIGELGTIYGEPLADDSQIPTWLVARMARQRVTVALSGDGGDELFCGYGSYHLAGRLWQRMARVPLPLRQAGAAAIGALSPERWSALARLLPGQRGGVNVGDKLHKGARLLTSASADALYHDLVSHWHEPGTVVIGGSEPSTLFDGSSAQLNGLDALQRRMAIDLLTYLPDDILAKVDRASMHASLETRVPLLDHRVVEFAWRLPQSLKVRDGQTKWVLRQVLYRHVPRAMVDRPKMGFSVPIADWLRGPLRGWAETLLAPARLAREGYFHPAPIAQAWQEHLSGKRNWQRQLWIVLMFQVWLEQQSHDRKA
jgi:asparagine synthase (glutamine-hydrolysing)